MLDCPIYLQQSADISGNAVIGIVASQGGVYFADLVAARPQERQGPNHGGGVAARHQDQSGLSAQRKERVNSEVNVSCPSEFGRSTLYSRIDSCCVAIILRASG